MDSSTVTNKLFSRVRPPGRAVSLTVSLAAALAVAALERQNGAVFPFELLYLIPVFLVAAVHDLWALAAMALVCDVLREQFGPSPWGADVLARFALAFLAYIGCGLFLSEMLRHRRTAAALAVETAGHARSLESTERQLHSLVEGTPAAILAIDPQGKILLANAAAHELFNCEPRSLPGQNIDEYLPTLANFRRPSSLRQLVRTMIECAGLRSDGDKFLANVWVSSDGPPAKAGLTAVIFDASEQLRNREETGLHTLALSAKVLMGAYWHEVRNLCSAMRVLTASLKRIPGLQDTEEVEALSSLANGLERLAFGALNPQAEESSDIASLRSVLEQLRIITDTWCVASQIDVTWNETNDLPLVRGDHHALLQVFLNLVRNAHRAVQDAPEKRMNVTAGLENGEAMVRIRNSGQPIADPRILFQPFHPAATNNGIGLYVSRAILRSFGGELRYEPVPGGSCFVVTLPRGAAPEIFRESIS